MAELKPCPFCSAEPEVLSDGRRTWGLIQHNEGCLFPVYPKHEIPESDFTSWNTRAETATLGGEYKRGYEDGLHANTKAAFSAAKQAVAATLGDKAELTELLDEFEQECFMLRVEASETRARTDVVRQSYKRIRDGFAGRIAATLGERTCNIERTNGEWHCSCCGEVVGSDDPWCELFTSENAIRLWEYCPNCGAKVVEK